LTGLAGEETRGCEKNQYIILSGGDTVREGAVKLEKRGGSQGDLEGQVAETGVLRDYRTYF